MANFGRRNMHRALNFCPGQHTLSRNELLCQLFRVLSLQQISFKIVSIDKEAKRISLSYKATLDNPWDKIKESIGKEVKIKVNKTELKD